MNIFLQHLERNVDFIVQRGMEKPIPIEVSYGEKDDKQIKRAIRKYQSPHGVIISNTYPNIVKKDNIIYIPCELFGFMWLILINWKYELMIYQDFYKFFWII